MEINGFAFPVASQSTALAISAAFHITPPKPLYWGLTFN